MYRHQSPVSFPLELECGSIVAASMDTIPTPAKFYPGTSIAPSLGFDGTDSTTLQVTHSSVAGVSCEIWETITITWTDSAWTTTVTEYESTV
jgi:hypothetical protein